MDAATDLNRRGQYFLLKYRARPTRGEERNVGVALVAEAGDYAILKHLPPSQLAPHLHDQGILDSALVGLAYVVGQNGRQAIERLTSMSRRLSGSLVIEPPMPADLGSSPSRTLDALFKALVARKTSRRPGIPKAQLLDQVVDTFRQSGAPVRRSEYLDDFVMDALVMPMQARATAVHVQSFAMSSRDWARAEREAGYFLYALERLGVGGLLVIQPPNESSDDEARRSFDRVDRWATDFGLPRAIPTDLARIAQTFRPDEQLPLLMA